MSREARLTKARQTRHATSHSRRQADFRARFAAARNPSQRVAAAADYLRGVLKDSNQTAATATASDAVRYLIQLADQLAQKGAQ